MARRPKDPTDAAQNMARGLTDLAALFDPLKTEAAGWLEADAYAELRRRMEEAHAATRAAAAEARRCALADEGRARRSDPWERNSELRRMREEQGLTQWDLARKSGVSRATIHRLENSEHKPRRETLSKLAHALDVEPEWIWWSLTYDPDEHPEGVKPTQKLRDATTPYIKGAARKYARKYGLRPDDVPDLESAGELGMLKGCYTFDASRGTDLGWWARFKAVRAVHDEARRLHRQLRPGPSVDDLESEGVELWVPASDE